MMIDVQNSFYNDMHPKIKMAKKTIELLMDLVETLKLYVFKVIAPFGD